jgi:hypothetical protein
MQNVLYRIGLQGMPLQVCVDAYIPMSVAPNGHPSMYPLGSHLAELEAQA